MEEVGTQVAAPPIAIHQTLAGRFCNTNPMAKKRGLPFPSSNFVNQNPAADNWNPNSWNWDSSRFVAKPSQNHGMPEQNNENLRLMLGGGDGGVGAVNSVEEPQPVSNNRPNKRVRSGSPGGVVANYPVCQVDNCNEDLSKAKDYHRRHKVCEVHSKAGKALVGKQMQRFHPLLEFDEGKRSCRRRLAGHNKRRRKTQPEETVARPLAPGSHDNNANRDMDIVNLLAVLARAQGITEDKSGKASPVPDKDQLIQILSKINSLPLPADLAAKLPTNGSVSNHVASENENQMNVNVNASSPSTMNLLAVLSGSQSSENQSQPSNEGSESEKSKQREPIVEFPCVGGERSSASYHSPIEDVDSHVQETSASLQLQLFGSSPEDNSSRILPSFRNYISSESSNPSETRSPLSSSPIVHDLFPMQTSRTKNYHLSTNEGDMGYVKSTPIQLFGCSIRPTEYGSSQSSPYQAGYASSSGSDHSPSSLNSDARDRTGRIIFKLFDKDPSHLPGSLRTQISNWLSNSPSEMESYIRPGCIVLSLYLSMPSFAWDQLEESLVNYVKSLIKDIDVDFWGNARFLVHTDRQMASHKNGKIRICKSWGSWSAPELISVSPVAIVGGQETSLLLTGRSLMAPGTKINCTHAAEYSIREVLESSCQNTAYDEISLSGLKINAASSGVLGRCFIEVENSFRGTSFPVIIADKSICEELRLLEPEIFDRRPPGPREVVLHFLNELGWLFQRKHNSSLFDSPEYKLTRFKFLLIFTVEHGFCALVKTLLDILLELNLGREGLLAKESFEMLSDIHLLNKAVKMRCRSMVDLLLNYSITDSANTSIKTFIFVPSMAGPGGITPLHLAACTSSSDDIVDALTSDPQEVGLNCWNSVLDANGLSPYAYALMRNNHSYNTLVAKKVADSKNGQISISIKNEIEPFQLEVEKGKNKTIISHINKRQKSCSKCAAAASLGYKRKFPGSQGGLLKLPYVHSMLVIAAVCVCVCVFLRGHPYVGCASPFAWENLDFGAF
ncbi:hypothetical protein RD792_000520 [Penstemon davidsonii]|uniref:SBP-type domain-containing protein n=1 Tax=Penstemon davidsonii TaxID=160366 RepID=A0ABR0DKW3_9LAMI|nr:hypothetical protein RD792_000520 [Penstemon davidsonii]